MHLCVAFCFTANFSKDFTHAFITPPKSSYSRIAPPKFLESSQNTKGSDTLWSIIASKKILEKVVKVLIIENEQEIQSDDKWTYRHWWLDGKLHNIKNNYISMFYFVTQVIFLKNFSMVVKEYKRFRYFVKFTYAQDNITVSSKVTIKENEAEIKSNA